MRNRSFVQQSLINLFLALTGTLFSDSRRLPRHRAIVFLERPFPPSLDQRKIQTQTDWPRVERPHDARVALHLLAVPCLLVVEKRIAPAALMRAGLVVDDPAHAVIHEGSVQDETPDLPCNDGRQGVFALVVFMPGKNPVSLLVGRSVSERNDGAVESFIQLLAVQAFRPESDTESVFAHSPTPPARASPATCDAPQYRPAAGVR